jgi:hypothetical protein
MGFYTYAVEKGKIVIACCPITITNTYMYSVSEGFNLGKNDFTMLFSLLQLKSSSTNAESAEVKQTTDPAPSYVDSQRALVEGDVQKKITPWTNPSSVAAELFPGSTGTKALSSSQQLQRPSSPPSDGGIAREKGGLILVASLLNKIPNLGGKGASGCVVSGRLSTITTNYNMHELYNMCSLYMCIIMMLCCKVLPIIYTLISLYL